MPTRQSLFLLLPKVAPSRSTPLLEQRYWCARLHAPTVLGRLKEGCELDGYVWAAIRERSQVRASTRVPGLLAGVGGS